MEPGQSSDSKETSKYRVKIRSKAVLELSMIAENYESRCTGVGENILLCVNAEIHKIGRHPFMYR